MAKTDFKTVDEYIATFPEETQQVLQKIRQTLAHALPQTTEVISYQIPAFKKGQGRATVYFSGYEKHVSLYPVPRDDAALLEELAPFIHGKGTLRFSLDQPIPYGLMTRIAVALAAEQA